MTLFFRASTALFSAVLFGSVALLTVGGCPGPDPQLLEGGGGTSNTTTTGGMGGDGGEGGVGTGGGQGGSGGSEDCDCDMLDVLIVIDNTDAIDGFVGDLAPAAFELIATFEGVAERVCSLHVGAVTSRPQEQNDPPCDNVLGALSRNNASGNSCNLSAGSYATEDDDLQSAVLCLVNPGTDGFGNERIADALLAALSPELNAPGACNDGFFRPEAPLLVVIISSVEDDDSNGEPSEWFGDLVQLNQFNTGNIASIGVIGPITAQGGCAADPSPRLHAFLNEHNVDNQASALICNVDTMDLKDGADRMIEAVCPLPR
ncbi:MAG TPA: hypothetical protein ENK57_16850 [Polyangiaceae bacterium]|nr:hypothetical protein [Polyangiaceae bacterium]